MPLRLPADREPWLDDATDRLRAIADAVEEEMAGLPDAALVWRPGADRWSVAHCLAHLTRTNALYREALSGAFQEVEDVAGEGAADGSGGAAGKGVGRRLRGSWLGRLFARTVGPDPTFRVTTPSAFRPREEAVGPGAVADFLDEQRLWLELVGRGRSLPLDRIRIPSPAFSLLRLRASDVLAVVVNHEERHLDQARAVLAEPGLPRG